MFSIRRFPIVYGVAIFFAAITNTVPADEFNQFIKPLFAKHCLKCHRGEKPKGDVNLGEIKSSAQLRGKPELIGALIDAIDGAFMPPEDEPALEEKTRATLVLNLKTILKSAADAEPPSRTQLRRLNRFQYNNSVRDLFQLKRDVFPMTEKLMTRHQNYLHAEGNRMPDTVQVSSDVLLETGGFAEVVPYPKDLPAAHGFDNQANQLTLSPLLLEAYLRLSHSILKSPDFTPENVGIWNAFFQAPAEADADTRKIIRQRIAPFMRLAFRMPVDDETLDRYTSYAQSKIDKGLSFTDAMKRCASAILCSPRFLYRHDAASPDEKGYELASRLSFFLWGSAPDSRLLSLAESGELLKPDVLRSVVNRMLADPKIERFLDSFPGQWMKLENLFGVAPDSRLYPQFNMRGGVPASTQMVLEPLLLFDAVFVENRAVMDLIKPQFAYRSDFLNSWYAGKLRPSDEFRQQVADEFRQRDEHRKQLEASIADLQKKRQSIIDPIRKRLIAEKQARVDAGQKVDVVDLKPVAAWNFDGDLKDSISGLDLKAHGDITFADGAVVLNKSYLESPRLPFDLNAKTLEVWCSLETIDQRAGGVMTVQENQIFDSIVYSERKPKHWISGSNGFTRTDDFPDATPETDAEQRLHLAMVYQADGTTLMYRNGKPYGKPFRKGRATFAKDRSFVLFGLRHLPAGGNRYLAVRIDQARLYNRALTADEVALSGSGGGVWVSNDEITKAMSPEQSRELESLVKARELAQAELNKLPKPNPNFNLNREVQARFDGRLKAQARARSFRRVPVTDPRYGGVITNLATMTMTSAPKRTLPIARGAWMIEVIFNDPPPPPPNDIPPLDEDSGPKNLTIREKFAKHRENPDCAGCHSRIDPLGFALENFDITGRWRDRYENKREVDATGTLFKKYSFTGVVDFKESLAKEEKRFAKAFTSHLLRFALARELAAIDSLTVDTIIRKTEPEHFKLRSLIREVVLSDAFLK